MAMPAPPSWGAAFLPGPVAADPPTGVVAPPALPAPDEPLAGPGIEWRFGPWRHAGSLALDGRWLREGEGARMQQGLIVGDLEFANYLWQPWFLQVRAGIGFVLARGRSGGDDASSSAGSRSLNGRLTLSLFPSSRFPFELRAEVGDSRSQGDLLGTDVRSQRLALSQSYRPPTGNDHLRLDVSVSRLQTDDGREDTLGLWQAGWSRQAGAHAIDLDTTWSRHEHSTTQAVSTQSLVSLRHGFTPRSTLSVDTLASWNRAARRERGAATLADFDADVKQLSTVANWRSDEGQARSPLRVGASLRWVQAESGAGAPDARVQAVNASLGASQEFADIWRASASSSASLVQSTGGTSARSVTLAGALAWVPAGVELSGWRYTPTAQAAVSVTEVDPGPGRRTLGLQGSHGVSREIDLGDSHRLSLNLNQSLGTVLGSGGDTDATDIAHSASLYWQHSGDGRSQRYAALSVSDARGLDSDRGTFQLVNLQLNQRTRLSRTAGWSANLTMQASRSSTARLDPFTGDERRVDPAWQFFYSGSISADAQRVFGVPNLRYALLIGATSQRLERRDAGDIDAPLEHVSASMEHRLDYAIGRLEARLSARVARIESRTIGGLFVRVQRRF